LTSLGNFFRRGYIIIPIWLLLAFSIYKDFGISWDEPIQMKLGELNVDYLNDLFGRDGRHIFHPEESLLEYEQRHYGSWYQLTAIFLQGKLGITDTIDKLYLRHGITLVFFGLTLFLFFKILLRRFDNTLLAYIGTAALVLNPRIFSHQFFNPKDAVFLSIYVLNMWALVRYLELLLRYLQ